LKSRTLFLLSIASLVLGVTYLVKAIASVTFPSLPSDLSLWEGLYWMIFAGVPVSTTRAEPFLIPATLFTGIGILAMSRAVLLRIRERAGRS